MTTDTRALAVNGTLMRGLELNANLLDVGATFDREDATAACYRLWSIGDRHPAMIRTTDGTGASVALEVWQVPDAGLAQVLTREPAGLCIGSVELADGSRVLGVLGVLAEPFLVADQEEITRFGGWRAFTAHRPGPRD